MRSHSPTGSAHRACALSATAPNTISENTGHGVQGRRRNSSTAAPMTDKTNAGGYQPIFCV